VEQIIPVADNNEAFTLKKQGAVIAGESECRTIEGYDLGNSPVELMARFKQKAFSTLAIKTSNLTPLLLSLPRALICSSLNLSAVARLLRHKPACILAAGGPRGASEDMGVAFALSAQLSGVGFDIALAALFTAESPAARHLREIGYDRDVDFIARVDVYNVVPAYDGRTIRTAMAFDAT